MQAARPSCPDPAQRSSDRTTTGKPASPSADLPTPSARTRFLGKAGPGALSEAEIETRVRLRADRQALLTQTADPLSMKLVLSETALCRQINGYDVMAGQMAR
ncbi:Scr1 family TA system antitoxin-like transcriptional regulator [Streptomyces griseoloalbus]|uniref:Scr1 family TA system antitoxin-like transcriptional regulator n=1 Tax=Streptomyces griseoloalbus TaxID=67303 RepID=UPI0033ABD76A